MSEPSNQGERRTVVVTGSTSGIGLGIARAFGAEGYNVVLNGFSSEEQVAALHAEWGKHYSGKCSYHPADLSRPADAETLMKESQKLFGSVDVLVNNAGIQHVAAVEDFPTERWDAILALNLTAAFHTTRAALPEMRRRGWGRIINISSAHGLVASVNKSAYVAAKHGLIGLTKVVALETAGSGITCNAICPGFVLTPLVQKQIDARVNETGLTAEEATRQMLREKEPSQQFTTVEQLGGLAVFLCGEAANNLTGASLPADGGWTAQ